MTKRGLFAALLALAAVCLGSFSSNGQTILAYPWGQSLTASSTSATVTVRQHIGTNVAYGAATDWSLGTGWAVSNGWLHAEGADSGVCILSNVDVTAGVDYYISFDVTNMAAGGALIPGEGASNVWVQAFIGGSPTIQYTQAQSAATSTVEAGWQDKHLWFAVSATNATKISVSNVVVYAYNASYAHAASVYNSGSSTGYVLANQNTTQYDAAKTAGTCVRIPAGMTATFPITDIPGWQFWKMSYGADTDEGTTLILFAQ